VQIEDEQARSTVETFRFSQNRDLRWEDVFERAVPGPAGALDQDYYLKVYTTWLSLKPDPQAKSWG
jgi:hypothetical protein